MSEAALIYTTWPDGESAAAAAALLLEDRLIACANIFAAGRSLYRWEGETCAEAETVMLLKTTTDRVDTLRDRVLALHPYDTPCILGIDLRGEQASPAFTQWLHDAVRDA